MSKGSSTTKLKVTNKETGEQVTLSVDFDWYYDAGVRYHADGSGTPSDSSVDMTEFESEDGEPLPDWVTDEIVQGALDVADLDIDFD